MGGKVLRGIKSFYDDGRACVRVGGEVSESFEVKMGLRQGCVMSPWLFNMYMDGVVRQVYNKINGLGVGINMGSVRWVSRLESVAFCRRYNLNGRLCRTTAMLFH